MPEKKEKANMPEDLLIELAGFEAALNDRLDPLKMLVGARQVLAAAGKNEELAAMEEPDFSGFDEIAQALLKIEVVAYGMVDKILIDKGLPNDARVWRHQAKNAARSVANNLGNLSDNYTEVAKLEFLEIAETSIRDLISLLAEVEEFDPAANRKFTVGELIGISTINFFMSRHDVLFESPRSRVIVNAGVTCATISQMTLALGIENILENAHRYKKPDVSPLKIALAVAYPITDNLVITIKDDGAGMAPERLTQLQQALGIASRDPEAKISIKPDARSKDSSATGLIGLAKMGVKIDVQSAEGVGTSVTLTVPLIPVEP